MVFLSIILVVYACLHDIKHHKIPNWVCFSILILGVLGNLVVHSQFDYSHLASALLGVLIGFALCIPLYMINLFGAGDAKLLASLGIIVGYPNIITLILVSIMFSGLLSLLRLICYGELTPMLTRWKVSFLTGVYEKPQENSVAAGAVPMGGAILLAYLYCYFYLF